MRPTTVLITGAGGFIGSNLVDDQLARGRKVVALDLRLDRLDHLRSNANCQLVIGDVRDEVLLGKIIQDTDIVFHLASAHLEVNQSEAYFWETNVDALNKLLTIARNNGVRRFVHCSSVGVYGPLQTLPANEETECHPDIAYEKSKLEGERAVRRFYRETNFPVIILRPAWVYGPRCPRTLKLFRAIKNKRFFMVGSGNTLRHPIYIGDMLLAFESAATREGVEGETFVIASSEPIRLIQLVQQIIAVEQLSFRPVTIPLPAVKLLCLTIERLFRLTDKEPPFSTRSLKFYTESSAFDISKACNILGFQPTTSLATGLRRTYEYNVANGLL